MRTRSETIGCEDLLGLLGGLAVRVRQGADSVASWADGLREPLEQARSASGDLGNPAMGEALTRLATLIDVWECLADGDDGPRQDAGAFLAEAIDRLDDGLRQGSAEAASAWILDESSRRWGEYLALVEPSLATVDLTGPPGADLVEEGEFPALDAVELLRRLTGGDSAAAVASPPAPPECVTPPTEATIALAEPDDTSPAPRRRDEDAPADEGEPESLGVSAVDQARALELDDELRGVFAADVSDLFGRIQELVLGLGGDQDAERLRELARCFHTLKGAAGSVGLTALASAIHAIEDRLGAAVDEVPDDLMAALEASLSMIEGVMEGLNGADGRRGVAPDVTAGEPVREPVECREPKATEGAAGIEDAHTAGPAAESDGLIRVPAVRFEELLELASDLIARRRFWVEQAEGIKELAVAARACSQRLRSSIERLEATEEGRNGRLAAHAQSTGADPRDDVAGLVHRLTEQAEDLSALAATAREASLPMIDEGEALSRLSVSFWETLQSVRIVPIRGLFQRLIRAAREAARVEGRKVEVTLVGEDTGADRPLLDRLYEPLLHVVRNAVGHGIEGPEERERRGKPPAGRITLEARREGNTLVVSIEDDGRGLDAEAIASKARRLGLIGLDESPGLERIHALIFHPGFSTRSQANAISGRGVGMDVVAREVGLLRGRIDLDSRPGEGTRLSVRLPSRLALEHMMIVRVDGQAYGVPIPLIESVHSGAEVAFLDDEPGGWLRIGDRRYPVVHSRSVLAVSGDPSPPCPTVLIVRADAETAAVLVDGVDGPRELVIKPLGALLAGHPAISGASLTTSGEVVLALDVAGLARLARVGAGWLSLVPVAERPGERTPVLVVDDSLSVRRVATKQLRALGFAIDEATDGEQALGKLRERSYRLILTDLEMPRMDGFELLAELGRTGLLATTPVVVASTRSDPETRRRALSLGAVAFLAKPFSADDLARAVGANSAEGPPVRSADPAPARA